MIPATLYFSNAGGIEEAIPFPEMEGDISVVLICGIKRDDRAIRSWNTCFAPNDDLSAFEEAFRKGMDSLEVAGGRVNGRQRALWIPYSVEFTQQGDDRHIRLYQHYGNEISLYGWNYSAPQRLLGRRTLVWWPIGCTFRTFQETIWVAANVTVDGNAEDVRALTEMPEDCRRGLEKHFSRSSFIPAYHEGKPVPAVALEPIFVLP